MSDRLPTEPPPAQELAALASALRSHLKRWSRQGVKAVPRGEPVAAAPPPVATRGHRPAAPTPTASRATVEKSVASQRTGGAPTASDTPDGADPNGRDVRSALSQLELTGMAGLKRIEALLGACTRCPLHKTRRHIVFGEGDPAADVVFIGEAPGGEENRRGRPFVGPAGQLLDRMLKAMGLRREQVYIGNILKCRPPRNRDPEPAEMEICEPFLQAQLKAIQPAIIVTLGRIAAQNLLRTTTALGRLRGRLHDYQGMKLMPTYHPAYLLRQPTQKRPTWQDLQIVMAEMDRQGLKRKK